MVDVGTITEIGDNKSKTHGELHNLNTAYRLKGKLAT